MRRTILAAASAAVTNRAPLVAAMGLALMGLALPASAAPPDETTTYAGYADGDSGHLHKDTPAGRVDLSGSVDFTARGTRAILVMDDASALAGERVQAYVRFTPADGRERKKEVCLVDGRPLVIQTRPGTRVNILMQSAASGFKILGVHCDRFATAGTLSISH